MTSTSKEFHPYGLSLHTYKGGKPRYQINPYPIASGYPVSIAAGDPVSLYPSLTGGGAWPANAATPAGTIVRTPMSYAGSSGITASTYLPILGVFTNVMFEDSKNGRYSEQNYWDANTTTFGGLPALVNVNDLPGSVFMIQAQNISANINVAVPRTIIGGNYNFATLTGSNPAVLPSIDARAHTSTVGLDISSPGFQCTVLGLADIPNNNWDDKFPNLLVRINAHRFSAPIASAYPVS